MNKWDDRFMRLAEEVATWSSCFKPDRHVGAVITKDKRILTTGYNGASSGILSCVEKGECLRVKLGIPSGTRHEICYAVHAEQKRDHSGGEARRLRSGRNALLHASTLHDMREDDHQCGHKKGSVQVWLSRRI